MRGFFAPNSASPRAPARGVKLPALMTRHHVSKQKAATSLLQLNEPYAEDHVIKHLMSEVPWFHGSFETSYERM